MEFNVTSLTTGREQSRALPAVWEYFHLRMLTCCFSDVMLAVVVLAAREGVMVLFELVMLFMILYKCLVLVEWSSVRIK